MTLPVALAGNDVIGQAKTGTGKTLAFGIPVLQALSAGPARAEGDPTGASGRLPRALVVVPTRELAVQVTKDLTQAASRLDVRVLAVYGGRAYEPQVEALRAGVDVVVGTPGRLLDLAQQRRLVLREVRVLVLDEADEMLDLGFLPDVERILGYTSPEHQTMLFSATMPGAVLALARRYMRQPTHIRAFDPDDDSATVASVEQHVFRAHSLDKPELLARMLQAEGRGLSIVFCATKRTAASVAEDLTRRGFAAAAVHGDLGQGAREQALRAFRNGKVDVLVATDVAARGIDVEGVTHVVNYSCPEDEKTYLHRIGRTARAGASGVAITLVDWNDQVRWSVINKALGLSFYEPVETYSTSSHLSELLGIRGDATGRLPRGQRTRAGLDAEEVEDLGETGRGRTTRTGRGGRPDRSDRLDRSDRPDRSGPARHAPAAEDPERSSRPPAQRQRRRLRGGHPLGAEAQEAGTAGRADAAEPDLDLEPVGALAGQASGSHELGASVASEAGGAGPAPRRRRRGGRGRGRESGGSGEVGGPAGELGGPGETATGPAVAG